MKETAISVIIPVYNTEKYLDRCMDSVLGQSFDDFEVILVDDGSTDGSAAKCDRLRDADQRIRVIHRPNGGVSESRNTGLSKARGRYITFVDSDDYIEGDYCEGLISLLEKYGADIACGAIRDVYRETENEQKSAGREECMTSEEALRQMLRGKRLNGSLSAKLFRRELFVGKRFPAALTYEDAYLLPELLLSAGKVAVSDRIFYTYWHHEGSITTVKYSERALDAITAYRHVSDVVGKECPSCIPEAEFRLYWAYFVVLDRMLASGDCKDIPQYPEVVAFLKEHTREITSCEFFEKTRRIAARALKAGVPFYRILLRFHRKRTEANE